MGHEYKPDDPVEVLHTWAHGEEPCWTPGYEYVRTEENGNILVRVTRGILTGCVTRWMPNTVRPAQPR